MTPEELTAALRTIRDNPEGDQESDHVAADKVLVRALRELGYDEPMNLLAEMQENWWWA
jgi:hypothetical protein